MNWLLTQIILLTVLVTSRSSDAPSVYVCQKWFTTSDDDFSTKCARKPNSCDPTCWLTPQGTIWQNFDESNVHRRKKNKFRDAKSKLFLDFQYLPDSTSMPDTSFAADFSFKTQLSVHNELDKQKFEEISFILF